jgi:hypothetical protein
LLESKTENLGAKTPNIIVRAVINPGQYWAPIAGQRCTPVDTLDAGISEFLSLGGAALSELRDEIAKPMPDEALTTAVQRFIDKVSEQVADVSSIAGNDELATSWKNLSSGSVSARVAAVTSLGRHPHPAVVGKLKSTMATDTSQHVRVAVIDALLAVSGSTGVDVIGEALCTDPSLDVQLEAALALVRPEMVKAAGPWIKRRLGEAALTPTLRLILGRGDSNADT